MTKRGIPERWEKYLPVGCRVPGTRFLPFKVPLKPELCRKRPETEWFTPSILLERNPSLRAVIDLTNTNRYYNREEFTGKGLLFKKINIVGGGRVPPKKIREEFFDAVDELCEKLEQDSDALIGVHCTHGLNRTGYLICKYMVLRLKIDPQEAINKFQEARGHPIERNNYVSDIISEDRDRCETSDWRSECQNYLFYPEEGSRWRENPRSRVPRCNRPDYYWQNERRRPSFESRNRGYWREDSRSESSRFGRYDYSQRRSRFY